jgi:hypothetical protein
VGAGRLSKEVEVKPVWIGGFTAYRPDVRIRVIICKRTRTSEYPVTCPLMPDLINEILVGGGEGLRGNSDGIEIGSSQYLEPTQRSGK